MATFHQALTLGGPTGTSPVLDPLAVLRLHNRLYMDGCRSVDRINCSLVTPLLLYLKLARVVVGNVSKKGKNMEGIIA